MVGEETMPATTNGSCSGQTVPPMRFTWENTKTHVWHVHIAALGWWLGQLAWRSLRGGSVDDVATALCLAAHFMHSCGLVLTHDCAQCSEKVCGDLPQHVLGLSLLLPLILSTRIVLHASSCLHLLPSPLACLSRFVLASALCLSYR